MTPDVLRVRIAERLKATGKKPVPLAIAMGRGRDYLTDLLKGNKDRIAPAELQRLAEELECDLAYFLSEDADTPGDSRERRQRAERGYPLVGKVGAGGAGLYADDWEAGEPIDWIEPLPGMPVEAEIIALETDGNSMSPLVLDGDLAFFGPVRRDVDALLNQRVMARLKDGRRFFKILKRGGAPGTYTLRSLNQAHDDIENVTVEWVLPYRGSRPR